MKQVNCDKCISPAINRRQAVSRLLQVVAGTFGIATIAGCPGGSTYGRAKLGADHDANTQQVGSIKASGNIELNSADVPENSVMELTIAGIQAYLYHGQVEGAEVWYATSRVCTHMRCLVDFNEEKQEFNCPCHRSKFAVDGTVLKPPAKRDLQSWEVVSNGDKVEIVITEERS